MAQPKNPPLSVRLPGDLVEAIEARAKGGEARNAVIVRLLRLGLGAEKRAGVAAKVPLATSSPAPYGSRLKKR